MDTLAASSFRRDAKVIGIVGVMHGMSHFFQLVLPPLFPLLREEFGVSYATLGALLSVFYVASGVCQIGAGFAVDRFGARPALFAGLLLLAGGTVAGATVPGVYWLFPLVALMGLGNGVFHPADFAVLNANVAQRRLGHAYSTHGIGGSLGYALAPVLSYGLASAFGWRMALLMMGTAGLVVIGLLATQRDLLTSRAHDPSAPRHTLRNSVELFRQPTIMLCFAYFCAVTLAGVGIQTFVGTSLNAAYAIPMAIATSAITAYLLGSTTGILAGGFLAARTSHHGRVAAGGLTVAAGAMMVVATLPAVAQHLAIPLLALTGFALGSTGPSRDLLVRAATPAGASGRVYGFVYSGLDLGATLGPVTMGAVLDHGSPRVVFVTIAACMLIAVATVIRVGHRSPARAARSAAAD